MDHTGYKPPDGAIASWDAKPKPEAALYTGHTQPAGEAAVIQPAQGGTLASWLEPERPPVVPAVPVSLPRVVVSMTSVPRRNGTLGPTLESLRNQSLPPDEIRLYLGPGCDAPSGVTCVTVRDRGPVTKLSAVTDPAVPADAIIVTADDDITYHPDWLAGLLSECAQHPEEAIGYAGWNADVMLRTGTRERASGPCDVVEGFGGVAYRKWFFGADVLDPPDAIKWVDDVWISVYLHRAGIARRVIPGGYARIDIARSVSTGIHTRPDFDVLNARAAELFKASAERLALESRRATAMGGR